ncbi:MAG: patatin-like phospholipase family protein [Gemmatimonadetes bacterium]|nr:patatin-like phospholipase family protein [Gemmatimonadota bacterium]
MRYSRVVCVLSGGGAKSAAHVGALRALEEWGLAPGHYIGTSMGAVIAACFASGLSYEEVLVRVSQVTRRDVARWSPLAVLGTFSPALLRGDPLRETIGALVPATRFDELKTPLTVTATDAASGQLVLFGAGGWSDVSLVDALYASCALPVFYPPAQIDGRAFIDGGLRAVLPLDAVEQFDPDLIFAVNVGPVLEKSAVEETFLPAMVRAHDMSTRIMMAEQIAETIERWRQSRVPLILVEPLLEPGTFAVARALGHVEEGYRTAYRELAKWSEEREK